MRATCSTVICCRPRMYVVHTGLKSQSTPPTQPFRSGSAAPSTVTRMRSRGAGLALLPEGRRRAMLTLAGCRQRLLAPLRGRGGDMPRKVRAGRPGPVPSAPCLRSRRPFLSFRAKRPGRSPPSPAPPRGRWWQRATAAWGCRCAPSPAPAAAPWQVGAGPGERSGAGAVLCGTAAVLRSAWGRAALSRFRSYDEGGPFSFAFR